MAISKTSFINIIRCPRYAALSEIKHDKLDADVSYKDYMEEELIEELKNIVSTMYDEEGNDLIDVEDLKLKTLLPYYKKVESIAVDITKKYFKGNIIASDNNFLQESFSFTENGIKYLCYIDIYNEKDNGADIIEVKATTSKKFINLGTKNSSIFNLKDNIYYLKEELLSDYLDEDLTEKKYLKQRSKLFDKYSDVGHYVYDLAVQRYFIEKSNPNNNFKYYLAVLNSNYVFDGVYKNNEAVYEKDLDGNEIINFIDLTNITKEYMEKLEMDKKRVEEYILNMDASPCELGIHCERKKSTKCKYVPVCYKHVPKKNSIFSYLDSHHGFTDLEGVKYSQYELLNKGYVKLLDIPETYLTREKNIIQRRVVETNETYINLDKIKKGIDLIKYPIYHLDFETFPSPIPRFKGEKCYTQSVFQFSLHVESSPFKCDKEKSHYGYLASDLEDHREELVKSLCEYIGDTGSVLVYNESFEKSRLKELAKIFPEYKEKLDSINERVFDLMYILRGNSKMYEALGFDSDEAKLFNYYHKDLTGSFSIKKILPLFSNLTYEGMNVGNGNEALVAYATFPSLEKEEFNKLYNDLVEYCKQDTWAMVEILWGLKKMCEKELLEIK